MFWTGRGQSRQVGVPVGLFADPKFPPPTNATFVPHKYPWFTIPEGVKQNEGHSERFLAWSGHGVGLGEGRVARLNRHQQRREESPQGAHWWIAIDKPSRPRGSKQQ